jgi:hypothetical protein
MADNGSYQRKPDIKTAVEDVKALATVLAMEAESILGRRTARVLGALALFAAVGGILVWYIAPTGAAEKQALIVTLAQILGGTALLSGLYFTWRTLQVNREGQITERFTRAIDQLGKVDDNNNKLFEIRVGGIYALERISRESEEDYWSIMEVLTAYVRQHARWRPEEREAAVEKMEEDAREAPVSTAVSPPAPDIQAIITVLRRRTYSYGQGEPEPLDLQETNLEGANFTNLEGANFSGANLERANFSGANLYRAFFPRANLSGASFVLLTTERYAVLQRAYLWEADLSEASLYGANLTRAFLPRANLSGAGLERANLYGATLDGADLSGATLWEADLSGASVYGANFSGTDLLQAQLEKTVGGENDENIQLPSHLQPPAHWGLDTDEQIEVTTGEQSEGE